MLLIIAFIFVYTGYMRNQIKEKKIQTEFLVTSSFREAITSIQIVSAVPYLDRWIHIIAYYNPFVAGKKLTTLCYSESTGQEICMS